MQLKEIIKNSKLHIPQERIFYEEPMKDHTSFKVGGPAEVFIKVENEQELQEIQAFANNEKIPIVIIGNGSNILVTDKGVRGIVAKIDIKKLEIQDNEQADGQNQNKEQINQKNSNQSNESNAQMNAQNNELNGNTTKKITVGAGNKLIELAYTLAKQDIAGLEELSGIPGTIGGAIRMNAGAHGKEMKDVIESVKVMDENGNIKILHNLDLQFEYRNSIFSKTKDIILEATMILPIGKKQEIQQKIKEYADLRKAKQPLEYPSAGSTFKRGNNFITAKLIDEAGLKGYQIGGAAISEKHAGFIVNKGNATAKDILELIEYAQENVYEKAGEKIELEVEILGEKWYIGRIERKKIGEI